PEPVAAAPAPVEDPPIPAAPAPARTIATAHPVHHHHHSAATNVPTDVDVGDDDGVLAPSAP
ncbi:MAG TPA: hypothetical protein VH560_18315, partial [Polyangia bacterium]|nr:hypothetical protein [Polyangia bacterium]